MFKSALIGSTGFVGGVLAGTHDFTYQFNRKNRLAMSEVEVDWAVCAAAPGTKWLANAEPEADRAVIEQIIADLRGLRTKKIILISTVDVLTNLVGQYEDSPAGDNGNLHPYGSHRRYLEQVVASEFDAHIIRLPALFGPGLKKNALFDLLQGETKFVDPRAVLQWYPLTRLWTDIERIVGANLRLVHIATEPFPLQEIVSGIFGTEIERDLVGVPVRYDMRTRYASVWGQTGDYIMSKEQVLNDIAQFVTSWQTGKV